MTTEIHDQNSLESVTLFTEDEHIVLAEWFGVKPVEAVDPDIYVWDALGRLGFKDRANQYSEEDAAVASIVLERMQGRLPRWVSVNLQAPEGQKVYSAKEHRPLRADRNVVLKPQHLLTIN